MEIYEDDLALTDVTLKQLLKEKNTIHSKTSTRD